MDRDISLQSFDRVLPIIKVFYSLLSGNFTDDESMLKKYKEQLLGNLDLINISEYEKGIITAKFNEITNMPSTIDAKEELVRFCEEYGYTKSDISSSKSMSSR